MEPMRTITSIAVPFDGINVDTDQIIPARFLGKKRFDQAAALFHDVRHDPASVLRPDFPLNKAAYAGAQILVGEANFGCGSSREQAVTVLLDNGFRALVAPSFGDIFLGNCFQNGVLPIQLSSQRSDELRLILHASPGSCLTVDVNRQLLTGPDGRADRFEIDSFRKDCLMRGLDEMTLTFSYEAEIAAFEARQQLERNWL